LHIPVFPQDATIGRDYPVQPNGGDMHPKGLDLRKMINTAAAAAYCGSSESTLSKLRIFGGGPVFVKIGRRVVYDIVDLDRWLAAHRRVSQYTCVSEAVA
jgi:hypothetical protein